MIRRTTRGLAAIAALLMSTAAWADPIPGLYNTGVAQNGAQLEPTGATDGHYQSPSGSALTYFHPAYAPVSDARWIAERADGWYSGKLGTWSGVEGDYNDFASITYTMTFDMTGLNTATARISGKWAADNAGLMYLNGRLISEIGGVSGANYSTLHDFTVSSGFLQGVNTITIVVKDFGPPSAFVISGISGTADRLAPPAWTTGSYGAWSSTCGSATRTRTVTCTDPNTGSTLPDSSCSVASRPASSESSYQTSGCGYSWTTGTYGSPAPACGASTMSRSVTCTRSDGQTVDASLCDTSTKPATEAPTTSYTTCSYSWTADPWSAPSTTCGQATQTRAVSCWRSDQTAVADSFCSQAGTKPVTSQSSYQTSGCGYTWKTGAWSGLVPACGSTVETRSVVCERSDGQAVADSSCSAGTRPADQRSGTSYATCSYSWETGSWSAPTKTCGSSTRTRSVVCRRSNGEQVDDSLCTGTRPDGTETVTDFSVCSYSWSYGAYGPSTPACGASSQSRVATCIRQDGQTVADSFCGASEPLTRPTTDYSACTFEWQASSWSTPSACGSTTRVRDVTCVRQDGTTAPDTQCAAGTRPSSSEAIVDTSACTYAWQYGDWSQPSSCGPTIRTRSANCLRQDGQTVADAFCTSPRGSVEEQVSDYSACSYRWDAGAWSTPSACGQTTRTRTVSCLRSDGTVVSDGQCDASAQPAASEKIADTSACQYSWVQTSVGQWSSCVNGSQLRAVTAECRRSDGTVVVDGLCASPRPTSENRACTSPVTPPSGGTGAGGGEVIFRRVINVAGQGR